MRKLMERPIDLNALGEDWEGNNIAVTCPNPACKKVFIVSGHMHPRGRNCPRCKGSKGFVEGGRMSGGTARIVWPVTGA
jgi:hypothetical protein